MSFGVWGVLVAEVNLAVAAVFSITLGIVVDDSVHFLSKYLRARRDEGLDAPGAVHYAFNTVGAALLVTTLALTAGFGILAMSDFQVNALTGLLTAITIVIALIYDLLFLPPLLVKLDRWLLPETPGTAAPVAADRASELRTAS
jgi:predicted RND superfamily exporter protein